MTAPALAVLALVIGYPIVRAIILSFYHYPLLSPFRNFIGAGNYQRLANDPVFWQSLVNTGIFTGASVVLGLLVGLVLALA
ncbi:MAG: sugar ABC transporter permease, partial [Streptosporangiales bacterium]|nr:sugar ABC transporter permease [Streptosporangiales bacterium]